MKSVLSIAGSDSSGGAGIQADIKTITAHGLYAMTAVTALTAQNTRGVTAVIESTPEFLGLQLDAVFTDIFPDAVKIGMLANASLIEMTASKLSEYKAVNIVLDPVMVATSGANLMETEAVGALKTFLFPLAGLITPNIPEAQVLSGLSIRSREDMEEAARLIHGQHGTAVLVKGGHGLLDASDFLLTREASFWFEGTRIDNPNSHGTGCTLSSAIASNLARGISLEEAVKRAKDFITGALSAMLDLGQGSGPLNHMFSLQGDFI